VGRSGGGGSGRSGYARRRVGAGTAGIGRAMGNRWRGSGVATRRAAAALLQCGHEILFVSFGLGSRDAGRDSVVDMNFLNSSDRTIHSSVNR
jgi:hypothetical protein